MARARSTYSHLEDWKSLWAADLEAIAFNGQTCDPTRVDPKVLQWVKKHCADRHKPHFIKVIVLGAIPDRPGLTPRKKSYCKLLVPSPFVERHFRKLDRVVKLENEAGKTWKVSFGAPTRHPSWQLGWWRVASDNGLKLGDIVVFVLVGTSHFRFTHFDEDGNKISHSGATRDATRDAVKKEVSSCSSQPASQSHDDSDSVWDAEDEPLLKTRNSKRSKKDRTFTAESAGLREHAHGELVMTTPGLGFDRHGHGVVPPLLTPANQRMSDTGCKRKRLCKVGEKKPRDRGNDNDAHDFEEAGSTSMAENPFHSTIASGHSPREESEK